MIKSGWLLGALMGMILLSSCLDKSDIFDPIAQYEKEQKSIDSYIESNNLSVAIDDSEANLRYTIYDAGEGATPKQDEISLVNIKGSVLEGVEFVDEDSLYIPVSRWILGYKLLLPYIKESGRITMFIPSLYGYGRNTAFDGKVTENNTLILNVELKETLSQLDYEQRKIDHYIAENNLMALIDTTQSLRYVITKQGEGEYANPNSIVNVDYTGMVLNYESEFDSNIAKTLDLQELVQGWRILMPYLKEGGEILMFIPSKFGYGASDVGNGAIPAYSTLLFEVKLNEILE